MLVLQRLVPDSFRWWLFDAVAASLALTIIATLTLRLVPQPSKRC